MVGKPVWGARRAVLHCRVGEGKGRGLSAYNTGPSTGDSTGTDTSSSSSTAANTSTASSSITSTHGNPPPNLCPPGGGGRPNPNQGELSEGVRGTFGGLTLFDTATTAGATGLQPRKGT